MRRGNLITRNLFLKNGSRPSKFFGRDCASLNRRWPHEPLVLVVVLVISQAHRWSES